MKENIEITHYLNKETKPLRVADQEFFPLFVEIVAYNQKVQIKSKINTHFKIYSSDIERITKNDKEKRKLILTGFLSDELFNDIENNKVFPIYHLKNDEVHIISKIIKLITPEDPDSLNLKNFSKDYVKYTTEISNILDNKIKELYKKELRQIFMQSIDSEEHRPIFNITNYLIHYINWNNSFWHFYESTHDLIPTEFKNLEFFLSNELRTQIKAYLAFHSKINVLKRFFEKRELGKISTLSYLDWQTDIKEFILGEFEKIFGEQKALQYVISIDNILAMGFQ